jgi:hypothetical protein
MARLVAALLLLVVVSSCLLLCQGQDNSTLPSSTGGGCINNATNGTTGGGCGTGGGGNSTSPPMGSFGAFSSPAFSAQLVNFDGAATTAAFMGKVHLVYMAANALYHAVSNNGVTFSLPVALGPQATTAYDPALVVVNAGSSSLLVLLFSSGSSNTLTYSVLTAGSMTFNTFTRVPAVNDVGGVVDAVYQTSKQQLVVVYVSTEPTTPAGYYIGQSLTAVIRSGEFFWASPLVIEQKSNGFLASWQSGTPPHC